MAQLTGYKQLFHADTLNIDSSKVEVLGMKAVDENGNEYIYLQGTASVVAGDWVVYNENYTTTRLVANEVGPVAVAPTAIVVGQYGWFQIKGIVNANTDDIAADKALYIDGTAGRVDDLSVAGDLVIGAYSMTAAVNNKATVYINYPHVSDDLGGSSGEISGPASSTDNAVVRWNGTAGDTIQNSGVIIDDSDNIIATATLTLANTGLHIFDTNASHDLIIAPGSDLTADRTLTIVTGDADRRFSIGGTAYIDGTAYVVGGTDVPVADGGTGASTAADARSNLGLVIGTDVQAYNAQLADIAGLTPSGSTFIVGNGTNFISHGTTAVFNDLGLGSMATAQASNVTITGGSITGITDLAVPDGGTGLSAATAYAVICGGTTSTAALQTVAGVGTSGQVLTSQGADALPVWSSPVARATQAAIEAQTDEATYISPDRAKYSPGVAKGWVKWFPDGSVQTSYNVASITDDGIAVWTINWDVDFSSSTYVVVTTPRGTAGINEGRINSWVATDGQTTGATTTVKVFNQQDGTLTDPGAMYAVGYGDQ